MQQYHFKVGNLFQCILVSITFIPFILHIMPYIHQVITWLKIDMTPDVPLRF